MSTITGEDPVRGLQRYLPELYAKSVPGSALRLAAEAISFVASRAVVPTANLLCRQRYVQAVQAVGRAIRDPLMVKQDETLYAILLLSGYEVSFGIWT